ncbi:hypothetical protein SDC9_180559 [bioreactor metagenome]|uniref:Uncharacterized protein n=1 Tax=bioreactor metagenome TaxID=1076179 RepID=A0A645H3L1_9ZZZZ
MNLIDHVPERQRHEVAESARGGHEVGLDDDRSLGIDLADHRGGATLEFEVVDQHPSGLLVGFVDEVVAPYGLASLAAFGQLAPDSDEEVGVTPIVLHRQRGVRTPAAGRQGVAENDFDSVFFRQLAG